MGQFTCDSPSELKRNVFSFYSAKALRVRGEAFKALGQYVKARDDLSAAQQIDYDDDAAEDLKFVLEKMKEIEGEKVKE